MINIENTTDTTNKDAGPVRTGPTDAVYSPAAGRWINPARIGRTLFRPWCALPACLLLLAAQPAPAAQPDEPTPAAQSPSESAENPARPLPPIDPALVEQYTQTLQTLADPSFEGRSPGSAGIEKAARLIEARFQDLGFQPAFPTVETAADGTEVITPRASYRQGFTVGQRTRVIAADLAVPGAAPLVHAADFSVLAFSGSGRVTAPVVFAGYAIPSGPENYEGFAEDADFTGRVALALAYEPLTDDGASRWQTEGFTSRAALNRKARTLIRRGAAAVLFVNPPNAKDDRVALLETADSTRTGPTAPRFDAPVAHITPELAANLIAGTGDPALSLPTLIAAANAGAVFQLLGDTEITLDVTMESAPIPTDNIGAVLPGVGDLAGEFIVIGAHYDHVGYGSVGAMPGNAGKLHPGADDNASGTTGMLIAAQTIAERTRTLPPDQPRRSYLFLAFSAEEMGLLGAIHYTKDPIVPNERHALMLNLDMIGTLETDPLEIGNLRSSPDLPALVDPHFERSALTIARDTSVGNGRSDHAAFDAVGVPNLFFFTGLHPRYHRPQDTPDLVDNEGAVRIALLAADIALDAAVRTEPLVHRRANEPPPPPQPTVRMGILPAASTKGGIIVRRVFPDTAASQAGLQPDDRILTWNTKELAGLDDLRPRLAEHSPGDAVALTVERGDQIVNITLTLRGIE